MEYEVIVFHEGEEIFSMNIKNKNKNINDVELIHIFKTSFVMTIGKIGENFKEYKGFAKVLNEMILDNLSEKEKNIGSEFFNNRFNALFVRGSNLFDQNFELDMKYRKRSLESIFGFNTLNI